MFAILFKKRVGNIEGAAGKFMGKHRGHRSISLLFFMGLYYFTIYFIYFILLLILLHIYHVNAYGSCPDE